MRRRLGEGSWIDDGYYPTDVQMRPQGFYVWTPAGSGHVLRWLDRSYRLRIR